MNGSGEVKHTEVVVVGAGPAGLSAALAAARAGARVTVVDNYRQPGGQYYRQLAPEFQNAPLGPHQREGQELWQKVAAAGVEILTETSVWDAFEDNRLALYGPQGLATIQSQTIILATGAYERVAAFPGWTLPGVITTGAAQTLLKEQRILPGRRIVLAGTGPLQLVVAAGLVEAGAEVVAVVEGSPLFRQGWRRPLDSAAALWGQWSRLAEGSSSWLKLREAGVLFYTGWGVRVAHGRDGITEVSLAQLDEQWRPVAGTFRTLACDTLCCSYGFVPATELARLLGVRHEWQPRLGGFVPHRDPTLQTNVPGLFAAGDCAGIGGARMALIEGRLAGLAAAGQAGNESEQAARSAEIAGLQTTLNREQRFQRLYGDLFTPGPGLDELAEPDTVICRCEEVTRSQINQIIRQGADTLEAVKALTRCGMGGCQGRVCGPLVAAVVARELEQSRPATGQFRVRPPLFPIPLAAFEPTPDLSDVAAILD